MKRVDLVTRFLLATLIVAAMAGATWFSPATAAEAPAAKKLAHAVAGDGALFTAFVPVLRHPRCMNCHPVKRQPTQGDDLHAHIPPVHAGAGDHGVPGLPCKSCHGDKNVATLSSSIASIPGHSHWGLAPASMAWQGKSLSEICVQLKDTARNGGRSLSKIHEHMATDPLVGWAWHPGEGRIPAPGTQVQFGALIEAWISTGAHCPQS